ncbi:SpoIIE family protein phosphatase [Streptomyces cynarae]|uniref:SpoIIE family protein phosphatase n=1 Tax=Streptomyces cynarae TaxID=2981134 RepID=A0ABY6E188_9ACTN|nr:SpoIIE family protein phosphatase [Streptomyces cynarae]UXY20370.1 SpoIIE family protein phosphatase [Streptomyces cynarae]
MGAPHAANRSGPHDGISAEQPADMVIDQQGIVVGWSPAAEGLLGYPAAAVLGRPVVDLLTGADAIDAEAIGPSLAAMDDIAVPLRRRDGAFLPCIMAVRPEGEAAAGMGWAVTLAPAEKGSPTAALDQALLETLFTVSPVGLFLLDPQLRLIRFNPAGEGMQGSSVEETVGRRPSEVWPGFATESVERAMEKVLATRQPVIGVEKRLCPPGDPEREHVYSASLFPLEDAQGRLLGVADATVDVTDRHLAQERLKVLAQAGTRIGSTLDVLDTVRGLADVSVPGLADSMAVEVVEPVLAGGDLEPGPVERDTVLRRAACRSRDDAEPWTACDEDGALPPVAAAEALADLGPRMVDPLSSVGQRALRSLRAPRDKVHSLMLVPLVAQDRALGLATFCRWGERRAFERDDLTLAGELALRTAACLDNARRYLRERHSLTALRHALRPGGLPPDHALEVAHEYVHAGSGGDWVDAVPLSGARVALVAGRVPGHGVQTAAAAGRLRAAVHTLSDLDLEPDELLARLDDLVRRLNGTNGHNGPTKEDGPPWLMEEARKSAEGDEAGATCLYLIYDPMARRCSLSSAGHPGPVIVRPDGTTVILEPPAGAALSCTGEPFEKVDIDLPEDSMLVLYTPGLFQEQPDDRGRERLAGLLAGFSGSVRQACSMVTEALIPNPPREDAAIKVARTHTLGPERVVTWDLPSDPSVVSKARSLVTRQLTDWDMDDATFTTELIASELVTNAIRYAKPPVRLRLVRGHVLTCEVSDGSSTSPRLRHARTTDEGGRGLLLVARCSERWGTRYTDDGKTVWVEQSIPERLGRADQPGCLR